VISNAASLRCRTPTKVFMPDENTHKLLHGVTLERMLNELVEHLGWERMARRVNIACFSSEPSVSSSLKFLRKTPWARTKVEALYVDMLQRHLEHERRKHTKPVA
jgi:uncharacterized protein (DUF2132 family)